LKLARALLPPTPLASGLVSTLIVDASSSLHCSLEIRRSSEGFLEAEASTEQREFAEALAVALRRMRSEAELEMPLVPGPGPGTDGETLSKLFSEAGLAAPSLRARKARIEVLDGVSRIVGARVDELGDSIQSLRVLASKKGVYEISWGGDRHPVPVIVKSEAFYEIGRFGGASDRKKGRPDVGRVDYRASTPLTALLYALLLSLQTGYIGEALESYMFTVVDLEPGYIASFQASALREIHEQAALDALRIGLGTWAQDYEGLRLMSVLGAVEKYLKLGRSEIPGNAAISHVVVGSTGRRFFPVLTVKVSLSEVTTAARAVEDFVEKELKVVEPLKVIKLLKALIGASLRMTARTTSSSVREVWYGVRMLARSFVESCKMELLDSAYRLMRLLSDAKTGLRGELIGTALRVVEELQIGAEDLELERAESRIEAVWRSLRRLIAAVTA